MRKYEVAKSENLVGQEREDVSYGIGGVVFTAKTVLGAKLVLERQGSWRMMTNDLAACLPHSSDQPVIGVRLTHI